jgi:hypothetical protein
MLARSARDGKVGGNSRRLGGGHAKGRGSVAQGRSDASQRAAAGVGAVGRNGRWECCEGQMQRCRQRAGRAKRHGERLDKAMHAVMGAASLLAEPS